MTGCRQKISQVFFAINELKMFENRTVDTELFKKKSKQEGLRAYSFEKLL